MRRIAISLPGVVILMGLALLAAVVVSDRIVSGDPRERPNVVLVVLDTVRPDHLSAYGYHRSTSPYLEKLSQQGVRFERAFSTAPWTVPSHASMFTGLYPSEHGCHWEHLYLVESQETLAERLKDRGYRTGGFVSNANLNKKYNFHQGFDDYVSILDERRRSPSSTLASLTNREVFRWLDGAPEGGEEEPVFLFLNYIEAHLPYDPPEPERSVFYDSSRGAPRAAGYGALLDRVLEGQTSLDREIVRELIDLYDGELLYLDRMLRELCEGLEERGILDNCLLIITSDHGESLGEEGLVDHQLSVADRLLRVPLILHWPGRVPAGGVVDEAVSLVGLYDMVLNAVEGGRTLIQDLAPTGEDVLPLLSESFEPLELQERLGDRLNPELTARKKVIRVRERGRELKLIRSQTGRVEAFECGREDGEGERLADSFTVDRLGALLDDSLARLLPFEELEGMEGDGEGQPLDMTEREVLESLGYLSGRPRLRGATHHAEQHHYRGFILLNRKEYARAARDFRMACSLNPRLAEPRFGLARALDELDHPSARDVYRTYLQMAVDDPKEKPRVDWVRGRLESMDQ